MAPAIRWNLDPPILVALAGYLAIYSRRWLQVRRSDGARAASRWRLASFCTGVAMLFGALISPIAHLGEQLFVFHMLQHIMVADLAAIFIILGLNRRLLRPVTHHMHKLELRAGFLAHPSAAVAIYVGNLWVWHIPYMYELGLNHPAVHAIQHISFSAAAGLFWWQLLSPIRNRRRLEGMGTTFYITAAKIITGLLAAGLTFSQALLYDYYVRQPDFWGIAPATDQALSGALMMITESTLLSIVLAVLFIKMLGEAERDDERDERYPSRMEA